MKQVIWLSSSKLQPLAHIASGYSHKPFKFLTFSGLQIVHVPAQSKYLIGVYSGLRDVLQLPQQTENWT